MLKTGSLKVRKGLKAATAPLDEVMEELSAEDPEFARLYESSKAKVRAQRGRPPKPSTKRGARELRFRADDSVHAAVRQAARESGRTVSNWILQTVRRALPDSSTRRGK